MKKFFEKLTEFFGSETAFYTYAIVGVLTSLPKAPSFGIAVGHAVLAMTAGFAAVRLVRIERKLDDVAYDVDLGLFETADDSQA